jgi:hypothetical protein
VDSGGADGDEPPVQSLSRSFRNTLAPLTSHPTRLPQQPEAPGSSPFDVCNFGRIPLTPPSPATRMGKSQATLNPGRMAPPLTLRFFGSIFLRDISPLLPDFRSIEIPTAPCFVINVLCRRVSHQCLRTYVRFSCFMRFAGTYEPGISNSEHAGGTSISGR